jgi:hypothetical protein
MGKQWNQRQVRSRISMLTAVGILVLLLVSVKGDAAAMSQGGGPGTPIEQASQIDWKQVDQAMGKPGSLQPRGVHRFSFPRTDLSVTIRGIQLKAGFALGSHVEFLSIGRHSMMMGDLVLTEEEANPVILTLQQEGIEQTAIHNHLLFESPRVMYLHIAGQGDPIAIAKAVHMALRLSKTPFTPPAPSDVSQPLDLDTNQLDAILKTHGTITNGIYQVSIPRTETITIDGMEMPPAMGVATALNFQPTGKARAAITGDFVLVAREVNPVIRVLRENGIEIAAIHGHSLTDEPRLFYLHFWANDDALTLAHGLRAALDQTNSVQTP